MDLSDHFMHVSLLVRLELHNKVHFSRRRGHYLVIDAASAQTINHLQRDSMEFDPLNDTIIRATMNSPSTVTNNLTSSGSSSQQHTHHLIHSKDTKTFLFDVRIRPATSCYIR